MVHHGRGVEAIVEGKRYAVGGPALVGERRLADPPALTKDHRRVPGPRDGRVYLLRADEIVGALVLEDQIPPQVAEPVADVHRMGRR